MAKVSELEQGRGTVFDVQGQSIALFEVDGQVHAIENVCPHAGAPLGEGDVDEKIVTCPWHGWQFDVTSGENHGDEGESVRTYPVKVDEDDILISLE